MTYSVNPFRPFRFPVPRYDMIVPCMIATLVSDLVSLGVIFK